MFYRICYQNLEASLHYHCHCRPICWWCI